MSEGTVPPAPDGSIFGRPNGSYGGPALAEAVRPYDPAAAEQAAGVFGHGSSSSPSQPYGAPNFGLDPNVAYAQALEQQGIGSLSAAYRAQMEQLIARYGDPNLANLAGFGLDPQAAAYTRQNYLSGNADLARLEKQNQLAKQAIINRLAAHGILFSGDTGYLTSQQEQQYGNQKYDLVNHYLDLLRQLSSDELMKKQTLHQGVLTAQQNALAQYLSNPSAYMAATSG